MYFNNFWHNQTNLPLLMLGESEGKNTGEISLRTEPTYKGMTPPSTQNLKALGLQVFFLICCSIFSFLPNVGLRLTLEYLTTDSRFTIWEDSITVSHHL